MNGGLVFKTNDAELSESFIDEKGIPNLADEQQIIKSLRETMRRERIEARSRGLLKIAAGMLITVLILMIGGVV